MVEPSVGPAFQNALAVRGVLCAVRHSQQGLGANGPGADSVPVPTGPQQTERLRFAVDEGESHTGV